MRCMKSFQHQGKNVNEFSLHINLINININNITRNICNVNVFMLLNSYFNNGDKDMVDEKSVNANRMSKNDYYLAIALVVSKRSTCLKRRYGAVIVNNDEIVSTGYNGNPRGDENCCDRGDCQRMNLPSNSGNYNDCFSVHAEQNAMLSASRNEMLGSTIFLAGEKYDDGNWVEIEDAEPCPICFRMIKNSGIDRVVSKKGILKLRD